MWTMARNGRYSFVLVAILAGVSGQAGAQGLNGALTGSVKDAQGGVLVGAAVRVTSPALIGGARTTASDDKGQWRFPILAPGTYRLMVEMGPKLTSYREDGISIGPGTSLERAVVLAVAGVSEAVVVEDTTAMVHGSGLETRLNVTLIQN